MTHVHNTTTAAQFKKISLIMCNACTIKTFPWRHLKSDPPWSNVIGQFFLYLFFGARGGGGLTGGNQRKCLNTSAAARWTPLLGVPFNGGFYCASFDTSFDGISRSVLFIYLFFTPRWGGFSSSSRTVPSLSSSCLQDGLFGQSRC